MSQKIKSVKDLKKLPSGNFLDTKTRIVYAKAIIEKEFAEQLSEIKETEKPKGATASKSKPKAKAKK